jgi:hypothetical protein
MYACRRAQRGASVSSRAKSSLSRRVRPEQSVNTGRGGRCQLRQTEAATAAPGGGDSRPSSPGLGQPPAGTAQRPHPLRRTSANSPPNHATTCAPAPNAPARLRACGCAVSASRRSRPPTSYTARTAGAAGRARGGRVIHRCAEALRSDAGAQGGTRRAVDAVLRLKGGSGGAGCGRAGSARRGAPPDGEGGRCGPVSMQVRGGGVRLTRDVEREAGVALPAAAAGATVDVDDARAALAERLRGDEEGSSRLDRTRLEFTRRV